MNIRKTGKSTLMGILLAGSGLFGVGESDAANLSKFRYQNEIPQIIKHSQRVGVDPALLAAVRSSENGKTDIAYGIIPQGPAKVKYSNDKGYTLNGKFFLYEDHKEKQLCWAAHTLKKRTEEFRKLPASKKIKYKDLIDFIGDSYCPISTRNDPNGLNQNWESNVRRFYNQFK